jgi:hypothetical protein
VSCVPVSTWTGDPYWVYGVTFAQCSVTDSGGLSAQGTLAVEVVDHTPPVLTLPSDIVTTATGPDGAVVDYTVTAHDVGFGDLGDNHNEPWGPVHCTPLAGSVFPVGTTTVSCNADDPAGVPTTGSFNVTVQAPPPNTPPMLYFSGDGHLRLNATSPDATALFYGFPLAVDEEDGPDINSHVSCSPSVGTVLPIGDYQIHCSVTDSGGLSDAGTIFITIGDWTPPVFSGVPANIEVQAGPDGAVVEYPLPTAHDDVAGDVPVTCSPPSGSVFPSSAPPSETEVICEATDNFGNTGSASFFVAVNDVVTADLTISPLQQSFSAPGETHTFTVTNQGEQTSGPLTLGYNIDERDSFPASNDTCSGVALVGGGTCTVDITYVPTGNETVGGTPSPQAPWLPSIGTYLVITGNPGNTANDADNSSFSGAALSFHPPSP